MRPIANQKGFGLVQIVVALGIVSVMTMGMIAMLDNMNQAQAIARAKMSALMLAQDVRAQLQVPSLCDSSITVPRLSSSLNAVNVRVVMGSTAVAPGAKLPDYSDLTVNLMRLENLRLEGPTPSGGSMYSGDLMIGATALSGVALKPNKAIRLLLATTAGGVFQNCSSADVSAQCASLGGSYDPTRNPVCNLSGRIPASAGRMCATSISQQHTPIGPKSGSATCCKDNETGTCALTHTTSQPACHEQNCTIVTSHYVCNCVPR